MKVNLEKRDNGESLQAIIERVIESDYTVIANGNEYIFDWKLERYNDVYKIYLKSEQNNILGLISLEDYPDEYRVNINLLETSKPNKGKAKVIDNIAGCLIGFAIFLAFERGYEGTVTLEPKGVLVSHYKKKYGFEEAGYFLLIDGQSAINLINKYLK
jgi:hypothetical protein